MPVGPQDMRAGERRFMRLADRHYTAILAIRAPTSSSKACSVALMF